MAETPRRFDDLVSTVGALRRRLDGLQATTLNRLGTHTHTTFGTVDAAYTSGKPQVTIDGATGLSGPLDRLASYTPVAGDRVVVAVVGGGPVVLGKVV